MALKSILVKHNVKSPTSNRLECGTCKAKFWMTCKYIDHLSTHRHFSLSCNICNKEFSGQKQLDEHYITHKEVVNTYDCKQCTRKFLQKYQLEQHMHYHVTFLPPNESLVKVKKAVHFNSILESSKIYSESSDNDSDSYEGYKPPKKTRSGRIVKVKKLFDDEPEVKRRRKSSHEELEKESVNSNNVKESSQSKVGDKVNVTEKPADTLSPSTKSYTSSNDFTKKLVILTERIPEEVYKSYVAKGKICNLDSSGSQKSDKKHVSSNIQTKFVSNGSMKNDQKVEKNMTSMSFSLVNSPEILNQKKDVNDSKPANMSCNPQSSGPSNSGQGVNIITTSNKLVCETRFDKIKINMPSKSDITSNKNSKTVVSNSTSHLPIKQIQNDSLAKKNVNSLSHPFLATPKETISTSCTSPRVDKQFLYVGPKQTMNKIKNIIEEMKTIATVKGQTSGNKLVSTTKSSGLSQNISNKCSQRVGSLNVDSSNKDSYRGTIRENKLNEHESANGVLEKTVLKDFILIKVTPERMKEMQRETLSFPQKQGNLKSLPVALPSNVSTMSCSLNKDLTQVSHKTETNGPPELVQKVHKGTLVQPQRWNGNLESFNAAKSQNISSVSSSLNKDLSKVFHMTERSGRSELIQKVHEKTVVHLQKEHGNLESSAANISTGSSSLNTNLSEVSYMTEKSSMSGLMQKVQGKTLLLPQNKQENLNLVSAAKHPNVITMSHSLIKNLDKISYITKKNKTIEVNDASKSPKVVLAFDTNIVEHLKSQYKKNKNLSLETVSIDKVTSSNAISKTVKASEQKTELNNLINKECTKILSCKSKDANCNIKEKLIERYKVKIAEKERKKREKYEFKKKIHYVKKILCRNNPNMAVSMQNMSKLSNSDILNVYKKTMLALIEMHNKNSVVESNLEDSVKLPLRSKKKSLTTEIVHELKNKDSTFEIINKSFTAQCPRNNTESKSSSSSKSDTSCSVDFNSKKLQGCLKLKSKQNKYAEEEAVEKAREISMKFEKTLSEEECLNLLDELDNLVTNFNIGKRCPFILPITRFCKLYIDSYKVKIRAISLQAKITQAVT